MQERRALVCRQVAICSSATAAPSCNLPYAPLPPERRHLGSFINGQRATMREPAAFFSVLSAFAEDLEGSLLENAAADAAAAKKAAAAPAGQPVRLQRALACVRLSFKDASFGLLGLLPAASCRIVLHEQHEIPPSRSRFGPLQGATERLKALRAQRRHSPAAGPGAQQSPSPPPASGAGPKDRPLAPAAKPAWSPVRWASGDGEASPCAPRSLSLRCSAL